MRALCAYHRNADIDRRKPAPGTTGEMPMLKILIADDHPMFREALRDLVAQLMAARQTAYACSEARDSGELFRAVEHEEDFDLILLDLFMPGSNGLADLVRLRDRVPGTPIVVVSSLSDPAMIRQAITCGAAGYVPKSSPKDQLLRALQTVLAGGVAMPQEEARTQAGGVEPEPLTGRQIAVLALLSLGKSNKEIANQLDISEMTVKAHMTSIMRKLKVTTRAQAIVAFKGAAAEHATSAGQDAARWRTR
jgi:DNA-binding NarL/FixJ family response regulator